MGESYRLEVTSLLSLYSAISLSHAGFMDLQWPHLQAGDLEGPVWVHRAPARAARTRVEPPVREAWTPAQNEAQSGAAEPGRHQGAWYLTKTTLQAESSS